MSAQTFTKEERLRKNAEFLKVRKTGKKISVEPLTLYVLKNDIGIKRLGLAVGKHLGSAAKRNKTKRILREFFRTHKTVFPETTDILIVARKCVQNLDEINAVFLEKKPFEKLRAKEN